MVRFLHPVIIIIGLAGRGWSGDEKIVLGRSTAKGVAVESSLTLRHATSEWSIESVTGTAGRRLHLTARYDAGGRLLAAGATLEADKGKPAVAVTVAKGKARVERAGAAAQEFDIPEKTIVTSAPDWTDVFLLCRWFDRKKEGKQAFTGLWIHPTQPAQRLTFTIDREGRQTVMHEGRDLTVDRFRIQIRGPNPYLAWADEKLGLIKILPLPAKTGGIVREGFEKSAGKLTAPER